MTIVFVGTAKKRTSSIAARISVEHKTRGSYKEDRASNYVDVFSVERGRKKRIKVSSIFVKDMTRNLVEHTFSCLTDILSALHIGQLAIITGLPVRPSNKFGFRSSVQKNGLPGEGRHEGLVLRNDVLTNEQMVS